MFLHTACRRFEGIFDVIQKNAINSWLNNTDCGIYLHSYAVDECYASNERIVHMPHKLGKNGIPELRFMWDKMVQASIDSCLADTSLLLNADNILVSDPSRIASILWKEGFDGMYLAIGQRTNISADSLIIDWDEFHPGGKLHPTCGVDYFIFGLPQDWDFLDIPPVELGAMRYDQWIVRQALDNGVPVIDITDGFTVYHQDHGERADKNAILHNASLIKEEYTRTRINHATYKLTNGRVVKK